MEAARSCDAEDTEKQINSNLVTGVHVHHKFEFQFMQILKYHYQSFVWLPLDLTLVNYSAAGLSQQQREGKSVRLKILDYDSVIWSVNSVQQCILWSDLTFRNSKNHLLKRNSLIFLKISPSRCLPHYSNCNISALHPRVSTHVFNCYPLNLK